MMRWPAALAGVAYALIYLVGLGDITLEDRAGWLFRTGTLSVERMLSMRSTFVFEGLAMVEAGWWIVLISPLNLILAVALGTLLALNVHGVIALWQSPASCTLSTASSATGALPALLAGSACCAPSLLLLLGIPALGMFAAFFGYLIPLSLLGLLASRIWQRRIGAPAWHRRRA